MDILAIIVNFNDFLNAKNALKLIFRLIKEIALNVLH